MRIETRMIAFSLVGFWLRLCASARQDATDRANSGLAALVPCASGCTPHALSPLSTALATRPR